MSLLNSVKDMVTGAMIEKAASSFGMESNTAKSAMSTILPAVLGGVINKGSSTGGASVLMDMITKGGFGDNTANDIMGVLGNSSKQSGFLNQGADLLSGIFGSNQSGVLDMITRVTKLDSTMGKTLMSFAAPLIMSKLGSIIKGKNMNASGLSSYLTSQKDEVMGLVPGLSAMLGATSSSVKESAAAAAGASYSKEEGSNGGGFLKWLLPLLILAALAYYLSQQTGCGAAGTVDTEEQVEETMDDKTVVSTTTTTTQTATKAAATDAAVTNDAAMGYTLADNGDILNASGTVAHTSLSYDVDADGNLIGTDGKMIASVSALSDDFRNRLAGMLSSIRLKRMKMMFTDMMTRKAGAEKTYALSDIEFKTEDHRIANFSKAEVEGLAAALKDNKTSKIEVHVYTADGKNSKDNAKRSGLRANVVRDMLVTLGVDKDQITAVGKGDADAAKAEMGKVDIVVN